MKEGTKIQTHIQGLSRQELEDALLTAIAAGAIDYALAGAPYGFDYEGLMRWFTMRVTRDAILHSPSGRLRQVPVDLKRVREDVENAE